MNWEDFQRPNLKVYLRGGHLIKWGNMSCGDELEIQQFEQLQGNGHIRELPRLQRTNRIN